MTKQDDCTPGNMAKNSNKSDTQKKVEDVRNYHPICTLPALYNLFSTFLCDRLYPRLDHVQPEDQGGFRRSYQTLDHLATYRLTEQKCQECVKMWIVTIYFMKAVDSTGHHSIWIAIEQCGIESYCISLLNRLYAEQKARALTIKESDMFEIKRRTKQSDPLSSLFVNTVLHVALKDVLTRWQKKRGMGICLSHVLLFSTPLRPTAENDV